MQYAVEELTVELIREIEPMLNRYYEATVAKDKLPPYNFDWSLYDTLAGTGNLVVTTARDDIDKLVGFAFYIVHHHPHHFGLLMAECDTIAVDMDYRGQRIGRNLYLFTEARLADRGVKRITNRYRTCYGTKPMFEDLGFVVDEHVYMKEL